jgi:hypothetical protein
VARMQNMRATHFFNFHHPAKQTNYLSPLLRGSLLPYEDNIFFDRNNGLFIGMAILE